MRKRDEWNDGHIGGAIHCMLGELQESLDRLPNRTSPITVTCAGGYRSNVGASVLKRAGFSTVSVLTGGMVEWQQSGQRIAK